MSTNNKFYFYGIFLSFCKQSQCIINHLPLFYLRNCIMRNSFRYYFKYTNEILRNICDVTKGANPSGTNLNGDLTHLCHVQINMKIQYWLVGHLVGRLVGWLVG